MLFFGLYQREVEKDLLPSGTEVIGQIVKADLDVARRPNSRLLWSKLDDRSILYRKDTIRTGAGSRALVRLSNRSSLALGENTLVVLETENESLSLRLADGDVEFSGNVTVSLDGKTKLRAVDGTLRLKRDSSTGKDKVAAVSGHAEVVSDGNVSIVEQGEVLVKGHEGAFKMSSESLEDAGLKDLGLKQLKDLERVQQSELQSKLSDLKPQMKIVQQDQKSLIRIYWQAPKEASKYKVSLGSKDVQVMEPYLDVVPEDFLPYVSEKISVTASGAGTEGSAQELSMDSEKKGLAIALGSIPVNKIPFDGSRVIAQKKKVKMFWSDVELKHKDFLHYNVTVKTPKGRTEVYQSKTASLEYELSNAGFYSWSVQAEFKNSGLGRSSQTSKFEVVDGATLAAPAIQPASGDN